ncbi:hypothetical protein GCM10007937_26560 [Mesorhizobium albiziae]|nr:hypothetical protein GCM10007937_26560 [Mesorhizobium albiziae]
MVSYETWDPNACRQSGIWSASEEDVRVFQVLMERGNNFMQRPIDGKSPPVRVPLVRHSATRESQGTFPQFWR